MSESYYLRRREPMEVYEQAVVLRSSGGEVAIWPDLGGELVEADGEYVTGLYRATVPRPSDVGDLRDLLAGGRYDLYDESGKRRDLEEVLGDAAEG